MTYLIPSEWAKDETVQKLIAEIEHYNFEIRELRGEIALEQESIDLLKGVLWP